MFLAMIRIFLGFIYLLFLPGFVWTWALWPKNNFITFLERILLSFLLSIAAAPLCVLLVSKAGVEITPMNSFIEITVFIMLGFFVFLCKSFFLKK